MTYNSMVEYDPDTVAVVGSSPAMSTEIINMKNTEEDERKCSARLSG